MIKVISLVVAECSRYFCRMLF